VDKHEILQYWIESSDTDFSAMEHLFEMTITKGNFIENAHVILRKNGWMKFEV
jgi:hypothetical protein